MFNYLAKSVNLNYSHVKFKVSSQNKNNLKIAIQALRVLNIRGANITSPYKREVMKYLDKIDKHAKLIGAVNTIVNKNGKLIGYNTDSYGAIQAIEKHLRKIKSSDYVVIFGAGGAARAIIFEICKRTKNVVVINRSYNRIKKLKSDFRKFNFRILPLTNENITNEVIKANFVINATSVGMFPNNKDCLISPYLFYKINKYSSLKDKLFFDVIFNPYLTKFLLIPKEYGAKVCSGLFMMIYQGIKAFELWTNKDIAQVHVTRIRNLLRAKIERGVS